MEHELSEEERNEDAFAEESGESESGPPPRYQHKRLDSWLPDMQKYCASLRGVDPASTKQIEEGSPIWVGTSEKSKAGSIPDIPVEDLIGGPTELHITKESDFVQLCERLQTIAFLMPDEYFDTSTWS